MTNSAISENQEAMREFIARAVLFQDAVARSVGLNSSDMQALGLLMAEGPASPSRLAGLVGLTRGGAITGVIDRLERAGYVRREPEPQDRRRVLVVANTDKVIADVGTTYGRVAEEWASYLKTLTPGQIDFATELFRRAAEINSAQTEALQTAAPKSRS
ncbi:MAG TPA: MarR family transcriptional regulator [Actinomycetales bacterium]|jgi:predicted transcriptional regulator|nr:MarR family transcriptional regulator [Actinomycetales bacterium]